MNFDFSEEQKLLQSTARDYLTEQSPLTHVREVFEADAGHSKALWKGVAELGWLGVAIPEEFGGAGYGYLELAMIAGEIGQALAPIPFGSTVYLAAEAITKCMRKPKSMLQTSINCIIVILNNNRTELDLALKWVYIGVIHLVYDKTISQRCNRCVK